MKLGLSPSLRRMLETSLLRLFNAAELKDAARIVLWRDRPPARAVSEETLERQFFGRAHRRLVHFLNRAELLYASISPHLLN